MYFEFIPFMCYVGLEYNIDLNVLKDVSHTPKDSYILERLRVHLIHIVVEEFSLSG